LGLDVGFIVVAPRGECEEEEEEEEEEERR